MQMVSLKMCRGRSGQPKKHVLRPDLGSHLVLHWHNHMAWNLRGHGVENASLDNDAMHLLVL